MAAVGSSCPHSKMEILMVQVVICGDGTKCVTCRFVYK